MDDETKALLRELINEMRMLREAMQKAAWASEHAAYWSQQPPMERDSAGNPRPR